jgi:hypothetical protein
MIAQVERAAEVVRRLRNLIRLGRSETAPVTVPMANSVGIVPLQDHGHGRLLLGPEALDAERPAGYPAACVKQAHDRYPRGAMIGPTPLKL